MSVGTEKKLNWDVVVVGAGAGGLAAACTAALEGASVLVLEQASMVGGTTAVSGGMCWFPANHKMAAAGRPDSIEAVRTYLEQTVPSTNRERIESFITNSEDALRYLESKTSIRFQPVMTYPDYYPTLPGATAGGRVLEPVPFDATILGKNFKKVRWPYPEFMLFKGMMISRADIPHLRQAFKNVKSFFRTAELLTRYFLQRLRWHRGTSLYLGNALVARLYKSALDLNIPIRTEVTVNRIAKDAGGRVSILEVTTPEGPQTLTARRAVILATGGISHDQELRGNYMPTSAGHLSAMVKPGNAPRGARLATAIGAAMSPTTKEGTFWVPASTFTRSDGTTAVFPHTVTDRAKPGLIAVDANGKRFVNECLSYHEFGRGMLRNANTAIPCWLIVDKNFLWKYGLGKIRPFTVSVENEINIGYLKRGNTLAELARKIGVPETQLVETVRDFNKHAVNGEDPEFGRGGDIYQRSLGDIHHKPNPCVAPIEHGPFYAVTVRPADLGMSGGLMTTGDARVVDVAGQPIPGLYACGNDLASVMDGAYPGPGITLGPALVFGWLAGRRAVAEKQA